MSHRVLITALFVATSAFAVTVPPAAQTGYIPSTFAGDVAIFPNALNPQSSRVIGTDQNQNGLFSFTLDGGTAEYLSLGPMRGVDVRSGLRFRFAPSALLVASSINFGLFVYGLNDAGVLVDVRSRAVNLPGVGALSLWSPPDGGLEAWLDVGTATLRRIAFFDDPLDAGRVDWFELDSGLTLPRSINGLAIDSRNRRLYATVPADGIYGWTIDDPAAPELLEATIGGSLGGAPSGLALYPLLDGGAVMLVAVASRDSYEAYQVTKSGLTAITDFQVGTGSNLVRSGQYLDVSKVSIPGFEQGMVAVADHNTTSGSNYKLLRWDTLALATTPHLPNEYDAGQDAGTVVILEPCSETPDGGLGDGGFADGGGSLTDAGALDAGRRPCVRDAGTTTGGAGGGSIGPGGGPGGSGGGGGDTRPTSCCGGGASNAIFPGSLVLLWTFRFRRRKT